MRASGPEGQGGFGGVGETLQGVNQLQNSSRKQTDKTENSTPKRPFFVRANDRGGAKSRA
jgi:hypothetical protein